MNLCDYSAVVVNISGGKDSQTILGMMMDMARAQSYGGQIVAVHADTGAEWPQSLPHCMMLCEHYGIPLRVALPFRPLPLHVRRRCMMMAAQKPVGKPGWPSADQRYCTSDCKRAPIEKVIRAGWPSASCRYCTSHCKTDALDKKLRAEFPRGTFNTVLTVTGERRQESNHRAKLPELEPDRRLSVSGRSVTRFRPALDLTTDQVWAYIAATGLPRHVAYDRGNDRVSCAICVFGSDGDIRNGAEARPDLAEYYLRIERETGMTFRHKRSLAEILRDTRFAAESNKPTKGNDR
jgi:3'-phosphoadenosine 5'-phosphosulfate sulfotransferase (PAPS reductase)/FAD synthetase